MKNKIIKLRIFLWFGLLMVLAWLLYMKIAPVGKISYNYSFKKDDFFINELTPFERVKAPAAGEQKIIGNPVYFSLFTPRRFDQAKISLKYKVNETIAGQVPLIEIGVLADKTVWRYDLKPVYNQTIDRLVSAWDKVDNGEVMLLQKNDDKIEKYKSVDEFLNNLPDREEIALYNYELKNEFKIDEYQATSGQLKIKQPLRGAWQLYTYIKNENLDFDFKVVDINKNKDNDPIDFNLYYQNELIDSRHMNDNGVNIDNGKISEAKNLNFMVSGLPEGVYKLELKAGDDIVTEKITTTQNKIAFINKLWIYSNGENRKLFTNSRKIEAVTSNPASLQNIRINKDILTINRTYEQFFYVSPTSSAEVTLEKADVILSGNGLFSFGQDDFFNPDFNKLSDYSVQIPADINYVLTRYDFPKKFDDWLISESVFDLANAYRENGKYNFLISIPGLRTENDNGCSVILDEIKIELSGKNIFDYIKKFF